MRKIRCAIYTRKSSEEGLEQEFNSLHAQRDACAAYVASQKHEGWVQLEAPFDDGGLSGGSLDRPALQRLLDQVRKGKIDQIVVYKIDRLTRSLADFSKIVDVLDEAGASFVSVTQSFNTATSMGRLTLNMLLSFAQFEREVTAERIRDKISASKRKGLWMGGCVPFGYQAAGRTLEIDESEAETLRILYGLYDKLGNLRQVQREAARLGLRSRRRTRADGRQTGGGLFTRGHIHHLLTNPIYAGRIRHKRQIFEGQHKAIIPPDHWDQIQGKLKERTNGARAAAGRGNRSPLCGKLYDETGDRLTPSHSKSRDGSRLRYYISHRLIGYKAKSPSGGWRLPAGPLERLIGEAIGRHLSASHFAAHVLRNPAADKIAELQHALAEECQRDEGLLDLLARASLSPGSMTLELDLDRIADALRLDPAAIQEEAFRFVLPFQARKRGVETKLMLADSSREMDETLICNIARAHTWFERMTSGETYAQIAATDGTSSRRIQQLIGLAFLAPDIIRSVLEGTQPLGFTSDWCKRNKLPSDWAEQRRILATL